MEEQIERFVRGLRDALGDNLVGAYLHGSAVLGGLRPKSDIDIVAVERRRTSPDEKTRIAQLLLSESNRPRPIEFDLLVESEIRPWRYPPPFDFHYSETYREQFERGDVSWRVDKNPDVASSIAMVLKGNVALYGPPPADVFDPVPPKDFLAAVLPDADPSDEIIDRYPRNTILMLPRVWSGLETGEIHSKESAAEWALPRLPPEHKRLLEKALASYRNEGREPTWDKELVRSYVDYVKRQIPQGDVHTG